MGRGRKANPENEALREQARERGDKVFTSILPCPHGHLARRVRNGKCHTCYLEYTAKRYKTIQASDKLKELQRQHARKSEHKRYHSDAEYRERNKLRSRINRNLRVTAELIEKLKEV